VQLIAKHMPFASVDAAAVDMIDGPTKQPRRKHKAGDSIRMVIEAMVEGVDVTIIRVEGGKWRRKGELVTVWCMALLPAVLQLPRPIFTNSVRPAAKRRSRINCIKLFSVMIMTGQKSVRPRYW
jgi:hypothetical protein